MLANGKVFKYGDNIDTDVIIPAKIPQRIIIKLITFSFLESL